MHHIVRKVLLTREAINWQGGDITGAGQPYSSVRNVLSLPILNCEGEVMGVMVAINKTRTNQDKATTGFTLADERFMLGMCAQLSEAIVNMGRRPEEYATFVEKLELLKLHAALPVSATSSLT